MLVAQEVGGGDGDHDGGCHLLASLLTLQYNY